MGSRGPLPKPTAILRARGSWRADINPNEPMPERITPPMPLDLDEIAESAWNHLVPVLERMGVLTEADGIVLERYVVLYSQWVKIKRRLNSRSELSYPVRDNQGNIIGAKPLPEVKMMTSISAEMTRVESLLGLNPSARSRIAIDQEGKRFLDGNGNTISNGSKQLEALGIAT